MPHYDPASFFGPETASRYDDQPRGDEADASRLLAELAGIRPAMSVSSTEMPMSTRALVHGRLMMLGTWWVLST